MYSNLYFFSLCKHEYIHKPFHTQLHTQRPPALPQHDVANMLTESQTVSHGHNSNGCTYLETKADGWDNAEHGGPGTDPAHRQETRVIFLEFMNTTRRREKEKLATIRTSFIMPWHLETLNHRVHLSITGARLTRASEVSQRGRQSVSAVTEVQGDSSGKLKAALKTRAEWFWSTSSVLVDWIQSRFMDKTHDSHISWRQTI